MTAAAVPAVDTAGLRKARGAFFTPEPIARYVTEWAVRSRAERVLEPSWGKAAFLLATVEHLARLNGDLAVLLQKLPAAQRADLERRLTNMAAVAPANARVLGRAYEKQVDVVVARWDRGPEIMISTKAQLSRPP